MEFGIKNKKFHFEGCFDDKLEHPCLDLLEKFQFQNEQLSVTPLPTVKPIKPIAENEPIMVENRTALLKLIKTLRNQKEIGVDGITYDLSKESGTVSNKDKVYVLSIATVHKNYILDLTCIDKDIVLLNEIFLNPKIVKIFNKLERQETLQNSGVYFVNIFDLHCASLILSENSGKTVARIIRDKFGVRSIFQKKGVKFFQRPMTDKTKHYCVGRVHHFIHLYHVFKNRLLEQNETLYRQFLEHCRKKVIIDSSDEFNKITTAFKQQHEIQLNTLIEFKEWRANEAKQYNVRREKIISDEELLQISANLPHTLGDVQKYCRKKIAIDSCLALLKIIKKNFKTGKTIMEAQKFDLCYQQITNNQITESQIDLTNSPDKKHKLDDVINRIEVSSDSSNKRPRLDLGECDVIVQPKALSEKTILDKDLETKVDKLLERVSQNNNFDDLTVSIKEETEYQNFKVKKEECFL